MPCQPAIIFCWEILTKFSYEKDPIFPKLMAFDFYRNYLMRIKVTRVGLLWASNTLSVGFWCCEISGEYLCQYNTISRLFHVWSLLRGVKWKQFSSHKITAVKRGKLWDVDIEYLVLISSYKSSKCHSLSVSHFFSQIL